VARDFRALTPFITALASVEGFACGPDVSKPKKAASFVHADFEAYVSLEGLIDLDAEMKRLEKQLVEKQKHLQGAQAKLNNANFVAKASAEVVQQQRDLAKDLQGQIRAIEQNLRELRQT
jgi:valyl-tRNA synthetase